MKYGYQVPLYRQEQMLASQGIDLDRATLALWMGRLAWWLKPLHDVLLDTVLSYPKLFADETPLMTTVLGFLVSTIDLIIIARPFLANHFRAASSLLRRETSHGQHHSLIVKPP
jgi:hypothetical protein